MRYKVLILAVVICALTACGIGQDADAGKDPAMVTGTTISSGGGRSEGQIADDMSISHTENEELIMIRIKNEYFDIRRRGKWLELHDVYTYGTGYPDMAEGACARVVADVDTYDGGEAGYMNDHFLKDVKSCEPVSYDEIAERFELADAGEKNIDMYDHMLVYHESGDCYLICLYRDKVIAYKDGDFFAEYDIERIEGSKTPEPFLKALEERRAFESTYDEHGIEIYIPESADKTIGVSMTLSDITPTGLTVHFKQYYDAEHGELIYGGEFRLQRLDGDTWEDVPTIIENWAFNDVGYVFPDDGIADVPIDWEWLYGRLDPGTYRITKTLLEGSGNVKEYPLTAQFIIADDRGRIGTYEITDLDLREEYFGEGKLVTMVRYYEMIDGTWQTDERSYKYRLVLTGRLNGAAMDSTFVYLSNTEDITFDRAWRAAGLSSDTRDYFDPEEAVLVAIK